MKKLRTRDRSGQAMVEYAIMIGIFLAVVVMMAIFQQALGQYEGRVLNLVASEYP